MSLQRGSEPFQREYSAPEPPAPARRTRRLALAVALVTFVVVGVGVFLLLPGGDERHTARRPGRVSPEAPSGTSSEAPPPASPSDAPSGEPTGQPPPSGAAPSGTPAARPITALPAPCGMVAPGTVGRYVPDARRKEDGGNSTLTTCTYSSAKPGFRWLRVEAHLHPPGGGDPVKDAEGYFDAQWEQAHDPYLERTISLAKQPGIGDEAYRWFKADKGQPTVVGQVTARLRNAVVTVSYSEQAPGRGAQEGRERPCLATAEAVAREVLRALH